MAALPWTRTCRAGGAEAIPAHALSLAVVYRPVRPVSRRQLARPINRMLLAVDPMAHQCPGPRRMRGDNEPLLLLCLYGLACMKPLVSGSTRQASHSDALVVGFLSFPWPNRPSGLTASFLRPTKPLPMACSSPTTEQRGPVQLTRACRVLSPCTSWHHGETHFRRPGPQVGLLSDCPPRVAF
jgi:hypothetical protein